MIHLLSWLVYNEDFNARRIREFDIFNHHSFREDCIKNAKKNKDNKEEFIENLRRDLMYYFWSKCEYEIILSSWPPDREGFRAEKISVYDQVYQHWDVFSEWVWENRKELTKKQRAT